MGGRRRDHRFPERRPTAESRSDGLDHGASATMAGVWPIAIVEIAVTGSRLIRAQHINDRLKSDEAQGT
jgi:hypothetical protein